MQTSSLIGELRKSLSTGMFLEQSSDSYVYVPNPVFRILNCCSVFERHFYKHLKGVSATQFYNFYNLLYNFTVSIPVEVFRKEAEELNLEQREIILRSFGKIQEQCGECDLVDYILILFQEPKKL